MPYFAEKCSSYFMGLIEMCVDSSQQIESSSLTQVLHHLLGTASAIQAQQRVGACDYVVFLLLAFLGTENPVFLHPSQTTSVHITLRQIVAVKLQQFLTTKCSFLLAVGWYNSNNVFSVITQQRHILSGQDLMLLVVAQVVMHSSTVLCMASPTNLNTTLI